MKLKEEEYYLQEYIKKYPIQYADNYLPETHIPPLPLYGEKEVTESEFNEILYKNKSKLVVIDWFMTTCPPCRYILYIIKYHLLLLLYCGFIILLFSIIIIFCIE